MLRTAQVDPLIDVRFFPGLARQSHLQHRPTAWRNRLAIYCAAPGGRRLKRR